MNTRASRLAHAVYRLTGCTGHACCESVTLWIDEGVVTTLAAMCIYRVVQSTQLTTPQRVIDDDLAYTLADPAVLRKRDLSRRVVVVSSRRRCASSTRPAMLSKDGRRWKAWTSVRSDEPGLATLCDILTNARKLTWMRPPSGRDRYDNEARWMLVAPYKDGYLIHMTRGTPVVMKRTRHQQQGRGLWSLAGAGVTAGLRCDGPLACGVWHKSMFDTWHYVDIRIPLSDWAIEVVDDNATASDTSDMQEWVWGLVDHPSTASVRWPREMTVMEVDDGAALIGDGKKVRVVVVADAMGWMAGVFKRSVGRVMTMQS